MKICANLPCSIEFEAENPRQNYCCHNCVNAAARRRAYREDPQNKEKRNANTAKWRRENPETYRLMKGENVRQSYAKGKIPPWAK